MASGGPTWLPGGLTFGFTEKPLWFREAQDSLKAGSEGKKTVDNFL